MAYLHFYDVVINDKTGVPIPGVIVRAYIRDEDNNTSTLADIYADDSGTPIGNVSGIPNAAVTDNGGNYGFFAAAGDYDIKFYVGDALLYVLQDITIGGPGVGDLTGPTGASFIGVKKDIPGSVLRNVAEVLEEIVQLSDFVLPTDASAAVSMQRCHDGLAAMGIRAAKVNIAAGTYVIDRNVMLNLVAIDWHGEAPSIGPNIDSGTVFDIQGSDFTPFTITRTLGPDESRGGGFHNIAVHQSQPDLAPGWEPIDYPAVFDCVNLLGEFTLNNIYGMHCTRLVKSVLSGRLVVSGLRGQFFKNIVEMDNSLDIPRFFDWHIWTYWTSADVVMQYQQANFVPFIFGRVDTPFLDHIFIFGADAAITSDQTTAGVTTKIIIGNLTCDFTRTVIRATSPILTAQIATLNHQGEAWPSTGTPLAGSRTIDCSGDNANIQIGNLQATTLSDASIVVSGNAGKVSIFSALWDKINTSGGYGAVYANPTCDVTVSDYDIINSGSTSLSSPTGSLANTAVSQNMLPSDDSRVYASSGAAGIAPKIYADGATANKDLELGAKGTGVVRSLNGIQPHSIPVASLPAVGDGTFYLVNDASNDNPGDIVIGGGSRKVLVSYLEGAWRIYAAAMLPKNAGVVLRGSPNIADSGNASVIPYWDQITPTDLMSRKAPTDYRYIPDMLRDAGDAIENYISRKAGSTSGGDLDHRAAFNRAVVDKACSRLLFNRPSYYFSAPLDSNARNMVFSSGSTAGGRPTIIFEDTLHAMLDFGSSVENIRFEGHWIIAFRDTPASSSVYGLNFNGCKNISFDRLTVMNTLGGCRFIGTTANIYFKELNLPAGVPFSTANTISGIVIERLTGGDTSTIGAGHDVKIGIQLPAILASIGLLTATANRHIRFNSSAVATLEDWIDAASWTPTVTAATPGDISFSGTASGTYWKYGKNLILSYTLAGTLTYTTASGNLYIGGVPVLFSTGSAQPMDAPNTMPAWTWPGTSSTDFFANPVGSQNYFQFVAGKSGSGRSIAQVGMWPSGTNYTIRGFIRAISNT